MRCVLVPVLVLQLKLPNLRQVDSLGKSVTRPALLQCTLPLSHTGFSVSCERKLQDAMTHVLGVISMGNFSLEENSLPTICSPADVCAAFHVKGSCMNGELPQ